MPVDVQLKYLLMAAIALEGLGGILFTLGTSFGAYLLVMHAKLFCNVSNLYCTNLLLGIIVPHNFFARYSQNILYFLFCRSYFLLWSHLSCMTSTIMTLQAENM